MVDVKSLGRYASLVQSIVERASAARGVSTEPRRIPIESGLALPIVELPADQRISIVDAHGHQRPVYRPLLIHSWLTAMIAAANLDPPIKRWIDTLDEHPLSALVFHEAGGAFGNPTWAQNGARIIGHLIAQQQPSGEFLPPDASANPESRWYEELILLHAAAGYAVYNPDDSIIQAVAKSARFHLDQTQPDHATTEPWGLLAFIQYAPAMADQLLHALTLQYPAGITGVSLLLMRDVLYGLDLLQANMNHLDQNTNHGPPHDQSS